jgi:serine/threonine protein kinase
VADKDDEYITKLQKRNDISESEFRFGQIVRTIQNYRQRFLPAERMCRVSLAPDTEYLSQCEAVHKDQPTESEYVLMTIPYRLSAPINIYLTQTQMNPRKHLAVIFSAYQYALQSIELLAAKNICHFDLHGSNLLWGIQQELPLIIDFGVSKNMQSENLIYQFTQIDPHVTWWALDISILGAWNSNPAWKDSDELIINMVDAHLPTNHYLHLILSPQEFDFYRNECLMQLRRHAKLAPQNSQQRLIESWRSWDVYSLSVTFLQIIGALYGGSYRLFPLLNSFVVLLLTNLNPDPAKRLNHVETMNKLEQHLDDPNLYMQKGVR